MDYMYFLRPHLSKFGEIEGISEEEIAWLEGKYEVALPEAYKQYMMIFGRKNGKFLPGAVMRIEQLEEIAEAYQRDLVDYPSYIPIPIGGNWYFFGMEENYFYFECDGDPNPKIWMMTAPDKVLVIHPSFTDLMKEELDVIWKIKI